MNHRESRRDIESSANLIDELRSRHVKRATSTNSTDNLYRRHLFPHPPETSIPRATTTTNHTFRFSIDDTDNEDLDTFSDFNSMRFNTKTLRTSPSLDDDFTQTDSRILSSSGYQSLDHSRKSTKQPKSLLVKSPSETDLLQPRYRHESPIHHYLPCCPNCIQPPMITVIPPSVLPRSANIIKRIQQPMGELLVKYLNFILISKNVFLLPLFIFLLRQRSMPIGN
jgi:hypothetical protein